MKKLLTALLIIAAMPVLAQTATPPAEFKEVKHSFGKIDQGKPVTTQFTFTNTSDKPIVIEAATAGCGCTKPEYPEEPILKGKTGVIKVTYNAANMGAFTKTVTVKFANVADPVLLTIEGEVIKKG